MTWEQRFGALTELGGDEWDVAYERLELEWRAAYTTAFVEIAVARGWRREAAERHCPTALTQPRQTAPFRP
jgi:hypothetical protein